MPKQPFDDIVPKRSIRSVTLKEAHDETRGRSVRTHKARQIEIEDTEELVEAEAPKKTIQDVREEFSKHLHSARKNKHNYIRVITVAASLVGVVILGVIGANMLGGTTISITPRSVHSIFKNEQFTVQKTGGAQDIIFQPIVVKKEGSVVVRSTGEKQVDERSAGTIVIYNNHTSTPQRLIKNTRFETTSGQIFRIDQSLTVPGKTASAPGSVEAKVYADEAGDTYNIPLSDFTIPGFKGDPRFKNFYARSKTVMEGGFSGKRKVVSDEDRLRAKEIIESDLKAALLADVQSKIPEGYIMFDSAQRIDWKELPDENLDASQVRIKEEGTFSVALFPQKALATYLARRSVEGYKNEPITINNLKDLVVKSLKPDFNPGTDSMIPFNISGDSLFVWLFDENLFKQALLNVPMSDFDTILNKFSGAISVGVPHVSPFWKSSFPSNPSKIKLNVTVNTN